MGSREVHVQVHQGRFTYIPRDVNMKTKGPLKLFKSCTARNRIPLLQLTRLQAQLKEKVDCVEGPQHMFGCGSPLRNFYIFIVVDDNKMDCHGHWFCIRTHFLFVGQIQYPIDHEILSTCHVGHHVHLSSFQMLLIPHAFKVQCKKYTWTIPNFLTNHILVYHGSRVLKLQ